MSRLPLTLATANKVVEEEELIVKDFCFSSCCHQGTQDGFDMTVACLLDLTCQVLFSQMYLFFVQSCCFFKCWLQNILRCSLIAKVRLDREICVPAQQLKGFLDARLCLFSPDVYFSQLRWGRASCLKKINELRPTDMNFSALYFQIPFVILSAFKRERRWAWLKNQWQRNVPTSEILHKHTHIKRSLRVRGKLL